MIEGIIVDAGHGGIDSGALGNNLQEKDLNLRAALYMYNRLKELGIPAKLVRNSDEYLPKDARIKRVKELYNNSPNTILISNHMNAGNGEGAEVVYSLKNDSTLADLILNNISESGQKVRKAYQRRLPENPNKDYYYILRETGNTTPLLVEYGFIDNTNDSKRLNNNLEDYVEGVVKALATYLGYNYSSPNDEVLDYYTVEKNDTLYSISRRFNISIDEIKRINNLNNDILSIGQRIYLKERNDDENIYIVQKGDTLYSISKKFNISVEEIKRLNNLVNNDLYVGEELIVIENNIPTDSMDYEIYEVVKGDSLWAIAKRYDIRVNDLIDINNLSNTNIKAGDKLLVPKKNIDENIYIVERGDTLWSISKKLGIPVNELKEINNLTSNLLTIGQTLKTK